MHVKNGSIWWDDGFYFYSSLSSLLTFHIVVVQIYCVEQRYFVVDILMLNMLPTIIISICMEGPTQTSFSSPTHILSINLSCIKIKNKLKFCNIEVILAHKLINLIKNVWLQFRIVEGHFKRMMELWNIIDVHVSTCHEI